MTAQKAIALCHLKIQQERTQAGCGLCAVRRCRLHIASEALSARVIAGERTLTRYEAIAASLYRSRKNMALPGTHVFVHPSRREIAFVFPEGSWQPTLQITMASKKTLTPENLEALGVQRLAELLVEIAEGDAPIKRRLRLELTARAAPRRVAAEVRKRLALIARTRSFADRRKARARAADLETQRRAIVEQVAKVDAGEALDLMWRFMELADSVHDRSDDSNGEIGGVFGSACRDLGPLAEKAKPDPLALADRVFAALDDNGHGQYDALIAPRPGRTDPIALKPPRQALGRQSPPQEQRKVMGWGGRGRSGQIKAAAATAVRTPPRGAQGGVDGYIAQYSEAARKVPKFAAEIARRLLAAGRGDEALRTLDAAQRDQRNWPEFDCEDARIDVLEALGRGADAQAMRWACFERALSARHLRAWLDRLPDFEDDEAEQRALDHAECRKNLLQALSFLVSWKALDRAARLVIARAKELDGDHYEILTPAAQALADEQPLAATLLLRAMIDFALTKARFGRYRHAARHLTECASLAAAIPAFEPFETHEAWFTRLKSQHGHKWEFWSLVA